jgi:sporulation protein YlmC with PRC-barrel domain
MDRLDATLDGVLHLLDRQVVDKDGLAVCKVDDVELREDDESGRLAVTGLLAGPAALVPRYGGHLDSALRRQWRRLGIEQSGRDAPWRIDLDDVERLGSAVELSAPRKGLLTRQGPAPAGLTQRRLDELLQMEVRDSHGTALGRIIDVRLENHRREPGGRLLVVGLLVGRGRPGSMLGYDRRGDQGPWLINRVVRRLHRHTGYISWEYVLQVDWDSVVVTTSTSRPADLTPA